MHCCNVTEAATLYIAQGARGGDMQLEPPQSALVPHSCGCVRLAVKANDRVVCSGCSAHRQDIEHMTQ